VKVRGSDIANSMRVTSEYGIEYYPVPLVNYYAANTYHICDDFNHQEYKRILSSLSELAYVLFLI
jgi:hypothetical protein